MYSLFFTGAKISRTLEGTRIIENDGTSLMLESVEGAQHLAPATQQLFEYTKKVASFIVVLTVFLLLFLSVYVCMHPFRFHIFY